MPVRFRPHPAEISHPDVEEALLVIPILLFSMVAHEYAHGYAALQQGDPTAYLLGRLTFNPLKHIDPWMTILLPLLLVWSTGGALVFGGARPVPVDPRNYRHFKRGDIVVSLAGIATNLVLALACAALVVVVGVLGEALPGIGSVAAPLQRMMFWGVWLNLLLAFFNLIPIPPLDGSHVLGHFLPSKLAWYYRSLARYGLLVVFVLVVFFRGIFSLLLTPAFVLYDLALAVVFPFALLPPPLQ